MNYNRVILAGRLTRDPELRYTSGGTAVSDISIAVNRVTGSGNDRKEHVTFVNVTCWGKQAETVCQYFSKGQEIFVEGRLELDTWTQQDGAKREKLKAVMERFEFVGSKNSSGGQVDLNKYAKGDQSAEVEEPY